ncbi:MAG TPA: cytochrome c oxidase subunit II [Actinomycetota bacterium]|nr:cytochrome c oxidase subunit II [Actinomycetota bacterium]
MTPPRRSFARLGARSLAVLTALLNASCAFGMQKGATEQGEATFRLWQIFMLAAIPVALLVYVLIAWCLVRYRRRAGDDPKALGRQFRERWGIEIAYTSIPILIVIGLFVLATGTGSTVDAVADQPDLRVHVEAYAWGWRFTYPEQGIEIVSEPSGEGVPGPVMVLPRGATVRIVLTSNDVIHSFWVPGFLYKHDAIPGRTFEFDLTTTRYGTYYGECAEFCGLNHAYMTFSVHVVDQDEFQAWVARNAAGATA